MYVEDSAANTGHPDVSAQINNGTISATGASAVGIYVSGSAASVTTSGVTVNDPVTGILVDGGTATITGGTIENNDTGIDVENGGSASISGVTFATNVTDLLVGLTGVISALANNTFTGTTSYIDNQSPNYIDATSSNTFGGFDPASISNPIADHPPTAGDLSDLAQLYAIEDKIGDGLDSASRGLVRIKNGALYVTQQSETSSSGAVGRAVGFSGSGDTIEIQGGAVSYAGNIAISIPLTIQGADSSGAGATEISGTTGNIIEIAASNVNIDDLKISGTASTKGLYINSAVSDISLANVVASGNQTGLDLDNAADVTGMTLDHVSLIGGTYGLLLATTARVHGDGMTPGTGMTVVSSHFDNNDYGWLVQANSGSPTNELDFTDILVTGTLIDPTTFNSDVRDGLYAEKLNDATIEYINVNGSGTATDSPTPHGVDLNFKYGDFSGISIQHAVLHDDGLGHSSVVLPGTD